MHRPGCGTCAPGALKSQGIGDSRHLTGSAACCGAPHPVHQQPMGRSAGVRRRRSSRLASGRASVATCGATSASKSATAAAMPASSCWLTALDCSDHSASLASQLLMLACAGGQREQLVRHQARMQGAGSVLPGRSLRRC